MQNGAHEESGSFFGQLPEGRCFPENTMVIDHTAT
jgi:hypothetical protein